jgi:hypothetical protein
MYSELSLRAEVTRDVKPTAQRMLRDICPLPIQCHSVVIVSYVCQELILAVNVEPLMSTGRPRSRWQ